MQQQIIGALTSAIEATAKQIAATIGEKNAMSSVNSALNAMRTDGLIECEKRKGKGNELVYWLAKPVCTNPQDDPITRRAPVRKAEPVFTQPAHDNEVAGLRAKLKLSEQQRDDHFNRAESLERALENTDRRLGIIGTMLINAEGDSIEDKLGKVLHEHVHGAQHIAELEKDVHRHSSGWQEASSSIIRFLIATQQITGMEHKPANMQEAEQQIAATIRLMQGRVEELEQTIHEMELAGTQAADAVDVKDAAVGYLVRIPKRKLRFCVNPENAREAALSGARVYGRAVVLALVPVGKAIRGAEWKSA